MSEMKKLRAGEQRYIVKKVGKTWRVYDKARGSFPYRSPETGTVQQDVAEDVANAEADRLNGVGGKPETVQAVESEKTDELPVKEEDIADYGVMTVEERAKYEDGLLEKVTY